MLSWSLTGTSALECLSCLTTLVSLHLTTVTDQQCSSLAQLTACLLSSLQRLKELQVNNQQELSPAGLRHLAGLQQLTKLCFWGTFDSLKVSAVLQAQLWGASQGSCSCWALVNEVRAQQCRRLQGSFSISTRHKGVLCVSVTE